MPIQYLQYPPKFLRLPAVPAVSNLKILGVQTYRIQTTASYLQHWQYRTMTYCQYSQYAWAVSGPEILSVSTRSVYVLPAEIYQMPSSMYVISGAYWEHWEYTRYQVYFSAASTRSMRLLTVKQLLHMMAILYPQYITPEYCQNNNGSILPNYCEYRHYLQYRTPKYSEFKRTESEVLRIYSLYG